MKTNLNEVQKLQKIAGLIKENVNEAPRAKKSSDGMSTIVLDTRFVNPQEFLDYLEANDITFMVQWHGPGGGNPIVQYWAYDDTLEDMIRKYFASDDEDGDWIVSTIKSSKKPEVRDL